jgi:hypothetical protein
MMNEVAGIGVERHASLRATHPTFLCILTLEDGDGGERESRHF